MIRGSESTDRPRRPDFKGPERREAPLIRSLFCSTVRLEHHGVMATPVRVDAVFDHAVGLGGVVTQETPEGIALESGAELTVGQPGAR